MKLSVHSCHLFCFTDSNGDGFFDESELEALFTKEVFMFMYLCLTALVF